jgi:hypothetical protein
MSTASATTGYSPLIAPINGINELVAGSSVPAVIASLSYITKLQHEFVAAPLWMDHVINHLAFINNVRRVAISAESAPTTPPLVLTCNDTYDFRTLSSINEPQHV